MRLTLAREPLTIKSFFRLNLAQIFFTLAMSILMSITPKKKSNVPYEPHPPISSYHPCSSPYFSGSERSDYHGEEVLCANLVSIFDVHIPGDGAVYIAWISETILTCDALNITRPFPSNQLSCAHPKREFIMFPWQTTKYFGNELGVIIRVENLQKSIGRKGGRRR